MREPEHKERVTAPASPVKPSKTFRRIVKCVLLVFSLLLGAGFGALYISDPTVGKTVGVIIRRDYSPEKAFPGQSRISVLLLGRDVDRDHRGQVVKTRGRTDTIILAHLDFANKTAKLLSIPRDTCVKIPGRRGRHKINSAHAYGGPELVVDTVERFLGVRPDSYVVLDYDAFVRGIDCLGGLDVKVDKELDYDDNWGQLHIHLKPGIQRLDGYQCMGFVRFRKSNDGRADTDIERIARQQEFIRASKQALMRPSSFLKAPRLLGLVQSHVNSSLTYGQQCSLAYFLKTLPRDAVEMDTLASDRGEVYARADEDEIRDKVQRVLY